VVAYAPPSDASLHDTWIRPADDTEIVYVPGGTFQMGSTDAEIDAAFEQCEQDHGSGECQRDWFENESPQHLVTLDAFWVDKTEVTNAQFERFVRDTNYRTDAEKEGTGWVYSDGIWREVDGADWQHPYDPETRISDRMDDYPVVQVSWTDARTYCQWAGGRLPTEAEWEYAVRGPEGHIYPWGDTFDGELANYCDANCPLDWKDANYDDGYEWTAPVGNYAAGASWVGVLDMAGNVWEWVNDWYDGYPGTTYQTDRFGTTDKVARGGSWDNSGDGVRAANRTHGPPGVRYDLLGFRCVVEPGD
jgi:formylglycine-generating enzyme required for sulfatase activity